MRHLDAAQVIELVHLAKTRVALGTRRALHQGDAVRPDRFVDLRSPRGEFVRRKIGGEGGEPLLRRHAQRYCEGKDDGNCLVLHQRLQGYARLWCVPSGKSGWIRPYRPTRYETGWLAVMLVATARTAAQFSRVATGFVGAFRRMRAASEE